VQYLVAAGNAMDHAPHYLVEGDRHTTNLYSALVGMTSKGRKGTSWGRVRQIMEIADMTWTSDRVQGGLSSGEGLIWGVRDPVFGFEKNGKGASAKETKTEIDPGINDKRLLIVEPELERVISVMCRDGNTLSGVVRDAWDRGNLSSLTKNSPARASGAHISLVAHITVDELRTSLDRVALANGFANRVLWICVKRTRELPFGGTLDRETIDELGQCSGRAIRCALVAGRVVMSADAKQVWREAYHALSAEKPGLIGAVTARAEAQAIRLALIYVLLVPTP
jgi:hypothetical protein